MNSGHLCTYSMLSHRDESTECQLLWKDRVNEEWITALTSGFNLLVIKLLNILHWIIAAYIREHYCLINLINNRCFQNVIKELTNTILFRCICQPSVWCIPDDPIPFRLREVLPTQPSLHSIQTVKTSHVFGLLMFSLKDNFMIL